MQKKNQVQKSAQKIAEYHWQDCTKLLHYILMASITWVNWYQNIKPFWILLWWQRQLELWNVQYHFNLAPAPSPALPALSSLWAGHPSCCSTNSVNYAFADKLSGMHNWEMKVTSAITVQLRARNQIGRTNSSIYNNLRAFFKSVSKDFPGLEKTGKKFMDFQGPAGILTNHHWANKKAKKLHKCTTGIRKTCKQIKHIQ